MNKVHTNTYQNFYGKETIDINSYGRSYGSHGNYSKNDQIAGRELLTADEIRMLDNNYALLFIRGERPIKDFKFNLKEHLNSSSTPIGNTSIKTYLYGGTENAIGTISFDLDNISMDRKEITDIEIKDSNFELLSNEEIENLFKKEISNN